MAYSSSIQVVNDANGVAYAFLSDNGQVWQCQWNPQAGQWEKAQVVPGASGGMKVAALFHPDLWNYKVDDDTATAPGIVLAYRVGSGKAAEVFTSLGQWNGQGELTWSTPVQLTSDQADDQAFSLLEGGPGAFSLVSQKQSAGASLATRATQTVAPEDSDLYRTDLQINISNPGNALNNIITLNNISSGTPISMGSVSFTAEPASTAPTPGPTSGNTQLSRDALITPPAPQAQPMAAMTLMSAAADASSGVAWSTDDAFQPSEQAQTFSWGWKQLGQSLQQWSVTWGQKDAVDDSESEDDDADPGQDGRKSKLNESHKALSETSNNPSNRDRSESNVSLDRDPSDLGLTIPVPFAYKHSDGIVRSDKEEKLDLTLAGSFGLRPSTSSSGTTTSSSGTLSVAKDDGSSTKDLFDKADKDKVFGRGKIPGWKTVGKGFSWAGGGELNTVYDYNFKSSGPNLLGITSTVSLGFEFSHKILSFSEEGSTFIFESVESLGGLYKYSLNSKANSVLPPWLAYFGLIGGAAAELEMLLAGGYNESLLIRFREDANYRARLGLGIQQAEQGSSSFFGSGAPEEPNKVFYYLNGINAAVGSLLAAGGGISSAILGSDFDTGTLTSGAALQDSVALTARYLFRSIIGLDLSATMANFTSWRNDDSGIIGIDQLTPSISAGVALPMGITLGLLDFSHSFDFNLDYGQKSQSTQAAQATTRSSMMASAEPMLATSNSTGSAGGNYYNADQQTNYPIKYTPQRGDVSLVGPASSSGAYAANPLASSTSILELFQLSQTSVGNAAITFQTTGSNLKSGQYSDVAILGAVAPGQASSTGATASFVVLSDGEIDPNSFSVTQAGSYLSLPAAGNNQYALILDLYSQGIAPTPAQNSFQSPWANQPLITVNTAVSGSPLAITPVQQVSAVRVPVQAAPSPPTTVWSQTQGGSSPNPPALATDGSTIYMAVRGNSSVASTMWWTSSSDGGNTWAAWQQMPASLTTLQAPSLAVVNGALYLSYLSPTSNAINITHLSDAASNTWASSYQIPGQTATQASLTSETINGTQQLAVYYVANDPSSRILKAYTSTPETSDNWTSDIEILYASGNQTASGPLALAQFSGQTYLAYQGGTTGSPSDDIYLATSSSPNDGSGWSVADVVNPGQASGVGLTSDSNGLILSYVDQAAPNSLQLSRISPQTSAAPVIQATTTTTLPSTLSTAITILRTGTAGGEHLVMTGINTEAAGYKVENIVLSIGAGTISYPVYDPTTQTISPASSTSNQAYTYKDVPVQLLSGSTAGSLQLVPLLNSDAAGSTPPNSVLATVVLSGGAIQAVELQQPLLFAASIPATTYSLKLLLPTAVTAGLPATAAAPMFAVTPQSSGLLNLVADDQFAAQAGGGKAGVYVAAGMTDGLPLDPSMAAWPLQSRISYVSQSGSGASTVVYLNGLQSNGANAATSVASLTATDLSLQNIVNNNYQFTVASHPTAIQLEGTGVYSGDTFVAWVEAGNPVIPVLDPSNGSASFQNLMQQLYGQQRINFRIFDSSSNTWLAPALQDLYSAGQAPAGGQAQPAVINHLQTFNVPDGSGGTRTMLVWSETAIQAIKGSVEAGFSTPGDSTTIPTVIKAGWLNPQATALTWQALLSDAQGNSTVQTIPWDSQTSVGLSVNDLSIASALLLQADGTLAQNPLITWSQAVRTPYSQSVLNDSPTLYLQFDELQSGVSDINIGMVDSAYTATSASPTGLNFSIAGALPAYQGAAVQNIDGTGVLNTGLGTAFSSLQETINNIPESSFQGVNQAIAEFTGTITTSATDASSGTLTVTAISAGSLALGDMLSGPGIAAGTTITAIISVDATGLGTYSVSQPQTVSTAVTMQAIPAPARLPLIGVTGSISGTTLSVTSVGVGGLQVGDLILGEGVAPGTIITAVGSVDASGVGSYSVNNSQTLASSALVATPNIPTAPYTLEFWAQLPGGSNPNGAGLVALGQPSTQAVGAVVAPSGWQLSASFQVEQITYQKALEGGLISSKGTNNAADLYGWGWSVRATGANTNATENGGGSNLYNNALLINNLYSGVSLSGVDAFLNNYNLTAADLIGVGDALANTVAVVPSTQLEFNNALEAGLPTSTLNGINILTNTAVMNQGVVTAPSSAQTAMFEALWAYQQATGQAKVNFSLAPGSSSITTTTSALSGESYAAYPLDFTVNPGVAVSVNGSGQLVFDVSEGVSVVSDATGQTDWRDGQWHYIVASYLPDYQTYTARDGTQVQLPTHRGTAQLYVDNQLVGSTGTITGAYLPINSNDSALLLANNNGGAIDQLAFYDRALTAISEPAGSGNWPQPTAADALKLLRELGYSLDTQTPNPGAIVGGVTKHWAVRNVNPNDAVQATFSSSYDASSGSWTTARPLNPSLAVNPTTPSYSTGGPTQDSLIFDLKGPDEGGGGGTTDRPPLGNQTLKTITFQAVSLVQGQGSTIQLEAVLGPDQIAIGGQSLASLNPQSSADNLNYVLQFSDPDIKATIPEQFILSTKNYPNITYYFVINTNANTFSHRVVPESASSGLEDLASDNAAIATAPLVAQAPLQLKYIDSGISLSSASTTQAANTPAVSSPANSFGQSQVIGSFSNAGVLNGWLAIAQPFSTNATSNPAGRIWIQYTGQSSNGNPSSTTAQAPSTWLNALANSNFSPDSPNLPLLHDSTYPSSVGGLLIQADPSDGWGQNFGQTMLVADLDQDGKQDLIIAAPQANGGGQVVIIAGSWIAANLTTAGATTTLNLSNLSGLGSAVTVLTPSQPSAASDDISVAGFGSALAVDTSTSKPTLWIGAPNYLRQLDANNTATPLVSLQPVGAVYSWQNGQTATALAAAALGYGGTVTSPQPNGTSISGSSTTYWGSQLGAAIATDGTGKIAISAPGVMASLLYSGTEVAQAIASGKTKPKAPDGDGALVQIQLPSVSNPNVSTTQGLANPALIPVATKDSVLAGEASTAMQNLKALQVNNIAQATQANNQAIQSAPVGAVYLFNSSADLSGLSQIDAQSTATTSNKGATFYGPNSWNTLGATGFGSSLSFGDFTNTNSDSVLAIGAPQTGGSGAAYLVDTSQSFSNPGSSGWLADLNLGSNQYLAHLASGLTLYGAESADNFGNGLLNLGDTNKDGYDDLLVQAFNAASGAGNGYVLFGSDQLIQYSKASSSATSANQPNPASGSVAMGAIGQFKRADGSAFNASILSELGSGLSGYTGQGSFGAGDANGDGLNDIPLGSGTNGKAYLTWGHPYLESINSLQLNRLTSDTGYLLDGLATRTPNSLQSIGDFNGDGYDDFLSIQPSGSGANGFTKVRIELGAGTQQILAEYNANFYSFLVNSGTQLWGAGDLNGDGYTDIALAPGTGQTWGAGIASGILYGRSSSDLPVGSSFGLVAPVDGNSTPQSPLPAISPGGSTDATPAVVAVGHALYSVVKAIGGTDLYFNQSLDGGLTWSNWTNLSTGNAGFSTNSAPTLAWFNDKLYLGFLNDASFYLSSWDPDASTGQWSAPTAVVQSPLNPSAFTFNSSYTPTLLASNNALQLIWVDPDSGELLTSTTTTPDQPGGSLAFASSQAVSTSQNPSSLARSADTLYMATSDPMINGTWQESAIAWSSSSDGGKTWDSWQQLPSEMQSDDAPSVAVVNGTLYLAYIDSSGAINITSLIDAASNQWSAAYRFPGQSSGSVSLITEPSGTGEQLAIYYVTQDANHYIYKGISSDPQSSQGWQYDIAVKDSNGTSQSASWIYAINGNNTANPAPLSLTRYNGETYIGYFDQEESGTQGQADYSITKRFYIATNATRQQVEPLGAASDDLASIGLTSNSSSLIASFSEYTGSSLHLNTYAQTNGSLDLQTSIAQSGSTPGFTSILNAGHEGNLVVSTFGTSANGGFNNSNTTRLLQSTSSWTSLEVMQVSVPDSTGGSTLTPITATGAPSAAWLGSTPVLATRGTALVSVGEQALSGFLQQAGFTTTPVSASGSPTALRVLGGTFGGKSVGSLQAQATVQLSSNTWLLAVNSAGYTKCVEVEVDLNSASADIQAKAIKAGYWLSSGLESDAIIQSKWQDADYTNQVVATSASDVGYGISELQIVLQASSPSISVYTATRDTATFTLASQFIDSDIASAPALVSTPTGLVLSYVKTDGSVSLHRLDVLDTNGVLLAGVQVNSNGVVDTSRANLQWQSTLLNASNGNLPAQRASVPVSVDEGLLLMNINASGSSTANQVWLNAVPPLNNPDSILWQTSALSRPSGFGDLNGDGRVDQFSSAGNNAIYTIPGMNYAVWDIRPAGDVNGNGHDDVLLALKPTGTAYVQTTPGQPSALQTVLLDGTLFHVDASNSFSLTRANGSASSGWTTSGLKAPLNPWNQAELNDLSSTSSSDYTPLLQNWINPILNFQAGELTAAMAGKGQIPQYLDGGNYVDARSAVTPAVAVSPDGTNYILHTGNDSSGGIYLAYQNTTNSSWVDIELTSLGNSGEFRSPSAAWYNGKLYVAYADESGNISIGYSSTPTDASSWTQFPLDDQSAGGNQQAATYASPTLLAEPGRLALYFPANTTTYSDPGALRAMYSTSPDANTWGSVRPTNPAFGKVSPADISQNYTGGSEVLDIKFQQNGVWYSAITYDQIGSAMFQGRPVLAIGQANAPTSTLILATPVPTAASGSSASSSPTWIAQVTTMGGGNVGLASDNAMLYLTSSASSTSLPSAYSGALSTAVPSASPGEWIVSTSTLMSNSINLNSNTNGTTTWAPFILNNGKLRGAWTDSGRSINIADFDTLTIATPAQQSLAGYSINGNLDTNGDGFADLLISDPSDPSKGVDNQYVLFGGDYLDLASQVGTPGDDVMQGTALADVIYSLAGSDLVLSNGGADVILTGTGDDQIGITGNSFHRIDAGAGFDQLLLRGDANQSYDFQLEANQPQYFLGTKLKNIELISSLNYGSNTLSFDLAGVNASNPDRILFVTPDSSDSIVLSAEFQRDSSFDTSFQGSLWSAYAALQPESPTAANPALLYVLNPDGASAASWLNSHVTITGAATPMLMAMRSFAVEEAPLPIAMAEGQAGTASSATTTPTTAEVVSSTRFGEGLIIEALRTNRQAGVARFRIRRSDTSQNQLLAYSSTSANSSTEPGRHFNPVMGLLRLEVGVSSKLITVPLVPEAIASHKDPAVSLRVEEIKERGQREAHLILHPQADGSGVRPVISGLELAFDALHHSARISLRADTTSEDLGHLGLGLSHRSSAAASATTATRMLSLADFDPSDSQLSPDPASPLPLDHDGRANRQVTANLRLDFDGATNQPRLSLLGPDPHGPGAITLAGGNQVRFRQDQPLTAWRSDTGAGRVTFGLVGGNKTLTLIEGAEPGRGGSITPANALDANPASGWLATEMKAVGSRAVISGQALSDLAWTPTALRDGVPLPLLALTLEANQVTATFNDGVSLVLWQTTGTTPTAVAAPAVLEIQRLAGYANSLAFHSVDSITGMVDGLNPGDPEYLQRALARSEQEGLLLTASQLPAYGQTVTINTLPINTTQSYGLLLLQDGDRSKLFSSFAAANPNGAPQMIRLGNDVNKMVLGIEDIDVNSIASDRDFNDIVLSIRNVNLPIF